MMDRFHLLFFVGASAAIVACAEESALELNTVTPPLGPPEGGTLVVIRGDNIQSGSTVQFGGIDATAVVWIDATEIQAVSPQGQVGAVDVTVTAPGGEQASLSDAFTYVATPTEQLLCTADVTPAFGETNVPVTSHFLVTFSRDIDPTSVDQVSLRELTDDGTETVVPATVQTEGTTQVRVSPGSSLAFFSDYTLSISDVSAASDAAVCDTATAVVSTPRPAPLPRTLRPAPVSGFATIGTTGLAVSQQYRGLQIYDLSTPDTPVLVGDVETDQMPLGIAVEGDRAYVPSGKQGVLIFDVSSPAQPQLLGVAGTPGTAVEVAPFTWDSRRLLAVADGPGGLRIIDATEPEGAFDLAALHPSGEVNTYVSGVAYYGDRLAVAQADQGFALVDVTDPIAPSVVVSRPSEALADTFSKSLPVTDVAVEGTNLFVAMGPFGFQAFDITTESAPAFLDFTFGPEGLCPAYCNDTSRAIVADEGRLYSASFTTGVVSFDFQGGVFGPMRTWNASGRTFGLTVTGTQAFVAGERGLTVFDTSASDGAAPVYDEPSGTGTARSVARPGNGYLYVASASRGLETYSLATPNAPELVDTVMTDGVQTDDGTADVAVYGDRLVLADGRFRLEVFDLTDPAHPASMGVVAGDDSVNAVELAEDRAFVCNGNGAMMVVDYRGTTPERSSDIALNQAIAGCLGLRRVDTHLYVAGGRAIAVLDVSTPDSPTLLTTLELPADEAVTALEVYGDTLYASTAVQDYEGTFGIAQRIWSFDITDRSNPVRVFKSDDLGATGKMVRQGDKLFMAASFEGVWVFSLSDPQVPRLEGGISLPGLGLKVAADAQEGLLYVAQGGGGIAVVPTGPLPNP